MKKFFLLSVGLVCICGCAPLLVGGGVAMGYSLGNDSASGTVKEDYRILWDLCLDKLNSMDAEIIGVNESKGYIKARVSENSVVIKINTLNPKTQKLKISARKFYLPKPQFAQKIYFKIVEKFE